MQQKPLFLTSDLRARAWALLEATEVVRRDNHGRPVTYAADTATIACTAYQLAELVLDYLDGQGDTIDEASDVPF